MNGAKWYHGPPTEGSSGAADKLRDVDMVRNLERRLERMVEGLAGKVFRGPLHPVELAARFVREADLALRDEPTGHVAPNVYVVHVHPSELGEGLLPEGLSAELAAYMEATANERGWRIEGPMTVHLELDDANPTGSVRCQTDFSRGPLEVWGFLIGSSNELALRHNRMSIGRGLDNDLTVDNPRVSRIHAYLWREAGSVWVADAGSSNGTMVDGHPILDPTALEQGSVVSFGSIPFTFRGA